MTTTSTSGFLLAIVVALLPIAGLIVGVILLFTSRRQGTSGEMSCGQCGYAVRGITNLGCPECGADLRVAGIRRGGSRGRRTAGIVLIVISAVALLLGCLFMLLFQKGGASGSSGGMAFGNMNAYYATNAEAERAITDGRFTVSDGGATYAFTPRGTPSGTHATVVGYDVEVYDWERMRLVEEKELIDLINAEMRTLPDEISALTVPGLIYSESPRTAFPDIQSFVEFFLEDRPHADYSSDEVRWMLPPAYHAEFDLQAVGMNFVVTLDWPDDERDLVMRFDYNSDEAAIQNTTFGLE